MTLRTLPLLLALSIGTGCIFGSSDPPTNNGQPNNGGSNNGSNNGEPNNGVPDIGPFTNGGTDMDAPDMDAPDMPPPEESYVTAAVREVSCPNYPTLRFEPTEFNLPQLGPNALVGTQAPPYEPGVGGENIGLLSLAYGVVSADGVQVFVGALDRADGAGNGLAPIPGVSGSAVVEGSEVLGLFVQNYPNQPNERIISATVATDTAIYECNLYSEGVEGRVDCEPSAVNEIAEQQGLSPVQRVEFAPMMRFENNRYTFNFILPRLLVAASGLDTAGQPLLRMFQIGLSTNTVDNSMIGMVGPSNFFGQRVAFGNELTANGCPVVTRLDAQGQPASFSPRDATCAMYEREDRGAWALSSRVSSPGPRTFSFVDAYAGTEANSNLLGGVTMTPGDLKLGYVGVADDSLILSRPGGFPGAEFVELPFERVVEVAAFKNLPFPDRNNNPGSGTPLIAVVHGQDGNELGLFSWNVELQDIRLVKNALPPGVTNAGAITPQWFYGDRGNISLVAESNQPGEWVALVVPVLDVKDLSAACP